jgi:hypothetical protein
VLQTDVPPRTVSRSRQVQDVLLQVSGGGIDGCSRLTKLPRIKRCVQVDVVDRYAIQQPVTGTVDADAGAIGGAQPVTPRAKRPQPSDAGLCRQSRSRHAGDHIEAAGILEDGTGLSNRDGNAGRGRRRNCETVPCRPATKAAQISPRSTRRG